MKSVFILTDSIMSSSHTEARLAPGLLYKYTETAEMSNGFCLNFNPNACAGLTPGSDPLEEAVQCGGQPGQTGDGLDLMVCSLYFVLLIYIKLVLSFNVWNTTFVYFLPCMNINTLNMLIYYSVTASKFWLPLLALHTVATKKSNSLSNCISTKMLTQ
jgi:hypothetical protein